MTQTSGQMKGFFTQFGDVTNLRLARNRKVWKDEEKEEGSEGGRVNVGV